MTMMRWDPWGEAMSLRQAMDRLLEDAFISPSRTVSGEPSGMMIPLDLVERGDNLVVKASMPGVRPEDVNITIEENMLTIEGEHREELERGPEAGQGNGKQATESRTEAQPRYHYRERRYGRFFRRIALPMPVDADKAEANFEHGVLTLTLPKAERARRRQIRVSGSSGQQIPAGQVERSGSMRK